MLILVPASDDGVELGAADAEVVEVVEVEELGVRAVTEDDEEGELELAIGVNS